jgi:hypothetical protein
MVWLKMNRGVPSFLILFICISLHGVAQKVKYKDLFVLLNARQYDQAEPFLRRYLKDNDDNPNAYLFMGIIYQEKANKDDILKNTERLIQNADSSVYFYNLAFKGITEKELKRNDEYYQVYNRRDLRTGEFGVKLSDVQFDLEKRINTLKERSERVKLLKTQLGQTASLYAKSTAQYKLLTDRFPDRNEFFLRADDQQNAELDKLINIFDSCVNSFNNYKSTLQLLGKTGYNQALNLIEIRDYGKDGLSVADFMINDTKLWDYKKWAQGAMEIIIKEIKPMRENLIAYDTEINKLREKLRKDSVSVKNDLALLVNEHLSIQLEKYDPDPMPMQLFDMKIAELEYASEILQSKAVKDSASVHIKLKNTKKEIALLNTLDSLSVRLSERNLMKDIENYKTFVTGAYGTSDVFISLIKTTKEFAEREKLKKTSELLVKEEALKWLIAAKDSIPLIFNPQKESKYKPLVIVNENYTAGLHYVDSTATGYFYSITPSRIANVKANFVLDKVTFKKRNLATIKGVSTISEKKETYFIGFYSESKKGDKFPLVLTKVNHSTGLVWSNSYQIEGIPSELAYSTTSEELNVKLLIDTIGEKNIAIDKNGKLVKQ